ncbi:hypothetical protein FM037_14350 [Shewanella psychropiezotolerans]|uniref:Uncharacterized protein n=1 Tax=Shewanella psychropiezotolerans TaxID=2593655 RepID=A0ABX5WZL5_9GAMM|nr:MULTISPECIES: beta/gamma crystallin domain-containing protein [Shewanella]MPY23930.1 hypothetical protein [Shewanella sp. YLB-07]QDO84198.1 hypothetical protein FM037_14350 [Shewanella psychropiezotolerans]
MSKAQIHNTTCTLFEAPVYDGIEHTYSPEDGVIGATEEGFNDKTQSIRVGKDVSIICWQHGEGLGITQQFYEDEPEIGNSFGEGISCFCVIPNDNDVIYIKLETSKSIEGVYTLHSNVSGSGALIPVVSSSDDPDFYPIGKMSPTQIEDMFISVQVEKGGIYPANGALYFKHSAQSGGVEVDWNASDNLYPKNMSVKAVPDAKNYFVLTLESLPI